MIVGNYSLLPFHPTLTLSANRLLRGIDVARVHVRRHYGYRITKEVITKRVGRERIERCSRLIEQATERERKEIAR